MNPERWQQIERVYNSVLAVEPGARQSFLQEVCAGDESLRREVEQLLVSQPRIERFIESPALEVAARGLAKDRAMEPPLDYVGRSLLHYWIVEKIGEGGMGVVYLAQDSSLNRKVALKFLPPEMQQDETARKRFLREARSAAALDHPYICHINEIGEAEGMDFIVMEYVEGQTLKDRLDRGALSLKERLQIAGEVAEALEEAHEKGIIHRDLKPANIMLTRKGHAKVMDFGLAKQLIPSRGIQSQEESITVLTRSGMTLGTLAYMSPQQLRGEVVDAQSDIFSFGVVFYEMLSGVHPFKKETGMDTASAILKDAPQPLVGLRPDVPALLQHIVKKMLAKDPRDRYPSIRHVRIDLKELLERSERPATGKGWRLKPLYWIAAAALVVIVAGTWAFHRFFPRETPLPQPRFVPITTSGGDTSSLSPDGNWVAFRWNGEKRDNADIYAKEVDGPGFNRLTTDPADDCCPAWSPDGRQIAFLRASDDRVILYFISPLGGGERKVAELGVGVLNWTPVVVEVLSWSPDGKNIAFVDRRSLKDPWSIWLLSIETLEKRQMTAPDASCFGDQSPAFSPNGRYLAFIRRIEIEKSALYVMGLPRGEPKLVTNSDNPLQSCWTSDSREIVFSTFSFTRAHALRRISVEGGESHIVPTMGELVRQPSVSRNRLSYVKNTRNTDIWRRELAGQEAPRLPSKPLFSWSSSEGDQCISPDRSRIAFASDASGSPEIWVCRADGTKPMKLTDMKAESTGSPNWSPDGKNIAFDSTKSGNSDIYVVSAEGGPVRGITTDPTEEVLPRWSRDGHWIYFGSKKSGRCQIWKMPPEGGKAIQVTTNGGMAARESVDGYVYYTDYWDQRKGLWRVPVSGGPETLVLDKWPDYSWDLTDRGIYFIDRDTKPVATVSLYDFAARRVRSLAPVHRDPEFSLGWGLSVSPDEKWLLYSGGIFSSSDIMMTDNFR